MWKRPYPPLRIFLNCSIGNSYISNKSCYATNDVSKNRKNMFYHTTILKCYVLQNLHEIALWMEIFTINFCFRWIKKLKNKIRLMIKMLKTYYWNPVYFQFQVYGLRGNEIQWFCWSFYYKWKVLFFENFIMHKISSNTYWKFFPSAIHKYLMSFF